MMLEERVKTVIREALNLGDCPLLSWYSINTVIMMYDGKQDFERGEIMEHIEDEFNIKIEDHVFDRLETVQDVIDLVKGYENERTKNVV